MYEWLDKQPCVKEESLTDWLLFTISNMLPNVLSYKAFTRHEESRNGCDWEWWILTNDYYEKNRYNTYRFLVQAKKLKPDNGGNYQSLAYANKNGLQIELLLNSASKKRAFPLYMLYSTDKPDTAKQIKNIKCLEPQQHIKWCNGCLNGGYLASALQIHELILQRAGLKHTAIELLNHSCKLSICDKLLCHGIFADIFFTQMIKQVCSTQHHGLDYSFKHNVEELPNYVDFYINQSKNNLSFFEREFRLQIGDIGGLVVIDLRDNMDL